MLTWCAAASAATLAAACSASALQPPSLPASALAAAAGWPSSSQLAAAASACGLLAAAAATDTAASLPEADFVSLLVDAEGFKGTEGSGGTAADVGVMLAAYCCRSWRAAGSSCSRRADATATASLRQPADLQTHDTAVYRRCEGVSE
jgi:hypothetical protein